MIGITGSSGFIGSHLCNKLQSKNYKVYKYTRSKNHSKDNSYRFFDMLKINPENLDLSDLSIFIHAAGMAHGYFSSEIKVIEFRALKQILKKCKQNNIKKFIYISSVSVYGYNSSNKLLDASKEPNPKSEYAKSKLNCEKYIEEFCTKNNINFIILRSPIVLSINAPGNLKKLREFLIRRIPLPFKSLKNKRSIVFLDHLTEFISLLIKEENYIKNTTILVCSKNSMSTRQIIEWICKNLNIPIRLFGIFDFPRFLKQNSYLGKLIGNLEFTGRKIKFTSEKDLNLNINVFSCSSLKLTND